MTTRLKTQSSPVPLTGRPKNSWLIPIFPVYVPHSLMIAMNWGSLGVYIYIYIYLFPVPGSVAPHHPPNGMVPPHYPPQKKHFEYYLQHFRVMASHLHAICSIPKPHLFVAFNSHTLPTKYLGTTNYVLPACCLHITYIHMFFLLYDQ